MAFKGFHSPHKRSDRRIYNFGINQKHKNRYCGAEKEGKGYTYYNLSPAFDRKIVCKADPRHAPKPIVCCVEGIYDIPLATELKTYEGDIEDKVDIRKEVALEILAKNIASMISCDILDDESLKQKVEDEMKKIEIEMSQDGTGRTCSELIKDVLTEIRKANPAPQQQRPRYPYPQRVADNVIQFPKQVANN